MPDFTPNALRVKARETVLRCSHGRWVGEAQFAACQPCILTAFTALVEEARREPEFRCDTPSAQVRRGPREGEVRFLTDDMDQSRVELAIFRGGNGDWYVGTVLKHDVGFECFVRVRTSGVAVHGMPVLIARLYRLLDEHLRAQAPRG